jgi:glycosyltransferase involved in cell wall biosynthesis
MIVGDLPAVTDIVDRDTAVVIPAGDAAALAEAVAALCADAAERRRLGRNGRGLVQASHTWTHRARRILEAVSEIANLPGARAEASGIRNPTIAATA